MRVLVFGAAGHVGSATCLALANAGHDVLALARTLEQVLPRHPNIQHCFYDVATGYGGEHAKRPMMPSGPSYEAIVYCVGHCPPGGFKHEIGTPLSSYPYHGLGLRAGLKRELDMHIVGPLNVFQQFLRKMADGGCFVFMSTAATRILEMPPRGRPPIHIYHHLAAIAAQNALTQGMRMDPNVDARGIGIHNIMPPRIVDSPFHNSDGGLSPGSTAPVGVTTQQVVEQILYCLSVGGKIGHQDIDMMPPITPI